MDPAPLTRTDDELILEFPGHPGIPSYSSLELAPRHYRVVRLHHGLFPGSLLSGGGPVLVRTRYYDDGGPEPWRAERELARP